MNNLCHPCHHIGPEQTCPQCGRETVPDVSAPAVSLRQATRKARAAREQLLRRAALEFGPDAVLDGAGEVLSPREQIRLERKAREARRETAPSWRKVVSDKES